MILGLLLAISLAITVTSILLTITSSAGIIQENLITGAAIGTQEIPRYGIAIAIISLTVSIGIILIMKRKLDRIKKPNEF